MKTKLSLKLTLAAIAAGVIGNAEATIINVSAGGDVQAAINTAGATGDEVVLAPGNYTGSISISGKSLTLRGSDPNNRPVFSFTATVAYGSSTAGMAILGDGTTVVVKDIIFLPGTTGLAASSKGVGTATLTAGQTLTVNVQNCLFAPNNGSNQPLFSDPFADTAVSGGWPNDIFYFNNGGFAGLPLGVGIYTVTDTVLIGAGRDGFICYPNAAGSSLTVTGSAVAHSARNGIQWGDDGNASTAFTITGTRVKPGLIMRNNNRVTASSGPGIDGINSGGAVNISRLVYVGNPVNAEGFVITPDETGNVAITDSLFASNADKGLWLADIGVRTPSVTVADSTFFANAGTGLEISAPDPTYLVRDNVFAGAGTGVTIAGGVGAKVTLLNNALVSAGPNALTAATAGDSPAANNAAVSADPQFTSTSVASLAALQTSFDVTNAAYATAGTSNSGLSGWGTAPPAPAAAKSWSVYE